MKYIILLTALVLFATRCEAQSFYYGITLGGDIGNESDGARSFEFGNIWYYSHNEIEPGGGTIQSKLGLIGGFEVNYYATSALTLSGSLLFDQKGVALQYIYTTESSPTPISTTTQTNTLDYLDVPLLLKWKPFPKDAGAFIFAGPSIGFLLSGKAELNLTVANQQHPYVSITQKNQPSISAGAGIGYAFDWSAKIRGEIKAAYAFGLTNDSFRESSSNGSQTFRDSLYNASAQDLQIMVTVLFPD